MSQDDEETIKYNKHHYIYTATPTAKVNDQTRRNGPLYENYMLNDNNNKKPDQLETVRSKSDQFNNVYRFESNTTNDASSYLEDFAANDIRTICSETTTTTNATYDTYENISLRVKDPYDKRELLQKYFRSALVGPRTNIYENLCRGCNYGVFNARGPLCTFCECLVNGVTALGRSTTPEPSLDTSNNIYENICEICDAIYSGSDCLECKCRKFEEVNTNTISESKQGSEEVLIEKSAKEKKKVKINKSKSFNKTNKPKIFTNLWDTLRKPRNTGEVGTKRKPLEIVHNVEGYEQVFHTKDTFDLQKICELKRSTTSCSDQHIYGRLKQSDLALSQEEFNSTQSLTQPGLTGGVTSKKPRISKPKFLRTQNSFNKSSSIESDFQIPDCTIYLNTSVCQWMTSLRREIHVYNTTFNQLTEESQCYPKSIPSKNALISCKAPVVTQPQTNTTTTTNNIYQDFVNVGGVGGGDLTEIVQMLKTHNSMTSMDSWNLEEEDEDDTQIDCYQLMVEEFMANIINRQQMLKTAKDNNNKQKQQQLQQQQHQQIDNVKVMAGVNNNDIYNNNNIPLRQALESTATTTTTTTTMTTGNHNNNNRHKRQGMYLRLEDQQHLQTEQQQQQQLYKREEQINLHNNNDQYKSNNNTNNTNEEFILKQHGKRDFNEEQRIQNENLNSLNNLSSEHNTVTTPNTRLTNDDHANVVDLLKRTTPGSESKWHLIKTDKRRGIHERNVLQAFEALLEQERCNHLLSGQEDLELDIKTLSDQAKGNTEDHSLELKSQESQSIKPEEETVNDTFSSSALQLQTFGDDPQSITQHFPTQIFDIIQLINQQQLSAGLNTSIIWYDKYLKIFLQFVYLKNTKTRTLVYKIPNKQLVRKFQQFYNYCEKSAIPATAITTNTPSCTSKTIIETKPKTPVRELTCVSSNLKLDLNVTCDLTKELKRENNNNNNNNNNFNNNNNESLNNLNLKSLTITAKEFNSKTEQKEIPPKVKTPPQVPKRDPKTKLSPTAEIKRFLSGSSKMTVPANNLKTDTQSSDGKQEEESIYQPIWKFETRGKVPERYQTDDDYYDLKALKEKLQQESPNSEIPKILISSETLHEEEEEDHNNWEPDEEFVFTKEMKKQRSSSLSSERLSNIRSSHSSNSSLAASLSLSGSTITEFASSTATLASTVSTSLRHYLFRNIGIFYSLTEPKLRAIIYDYDRIHSSRYFAKPLTDQQLNVNDSGLGKSLSPLQAPKKYSSKSSLEYSTPSTSANSSPVAANKREILNKSSAAAAAASESVNKAKVPSSPTQTYQIPSSVQAWKYQLLDVNYMEDEEDMIVSECEILRAQQIKEDLDQSPQSQPQQFIQRFKSRSTENFIDLPIEDDKKTFTERLANMYTRFSPIQRGILNINGRNSPKSDKKTYKLNRASQSTSLYLEDGLKPKKPIFGAPLDQLELQQNVPRFVVDAVEYIERKDRIIQDGIYRACGNKFSIDELKQKLSKSYIYDSKLIVADDIHTVTSLLKQFFRDLPEPVVPQEIYSRITANLADKQGVDAIRIAIEEMKEPNKSTLRFLIKHLTNVAACSSSNRMNASNMAIVWGPSLFAQNDTYDMIGRMNTLTKVLIENYDRIFDTNERLL